MSNLRQIALFMQYYTDDYRDTFRRIATRTKVTMLARP